MQEQGEQGCVGPQARVKSSDFLLSVQGRIYIGFTFTKDQLLSGSAPPLAKSIETVNRARIRPGLIWSWAGWELNWVKGEN